ncbi:hypothetical protein ANAPC1_01498 [Anaplasma phagocytophilum]|uniref:Uncharacterized protein n=1 Tax=Anaplasma phagocytophilum TaxID=948 RepID=A0AA45ZI95_ANAPH|nr:hypothetical protein ANAPC1_01498 [Anaplasma phagocytophilum]SCV65481.1 hypothetical protein ANAPC5_01164 [Anaplasma phagocytophilum]
MMLLLIRLTSLVMLLLRYAGRTLLNLLRLLIFLILLLGTRFVRRRWVALRISMRSIMMRPRRRGGVRAEPHCVVMPVPTTEV